ncbi:hypothetical protein [Dokdonella sp.]|uniref:hypothetical protein n=1 Tax=Dokdonella sp. TaxID=2291710 RepID=UPI001B12F874|nr:hypothetical protein [Dokdonella sp.]MBO9662746.1 hypothetical protein [Dokdonella sp.]
MTIRSRRLRGRHIAVLHARRTGALCALLFVAAPAFAQTIVPNANLDTQFAPWQPFVSTAPDPVGNGDAPVWVAAPDWNGSPTSGSARIDLHASGAAANAASGMAQCVDFSSATLIHFVNYGMSFEVPATTADDGSLSATIELRLFTDPGCSGFISGGTQGQTIAPGTAADAVWYGLGDNSFVPAGAPVTAASAEVRGYLRRTGTAPSQSDYPIHLDHFVLVLNDTTPVELMQFYVE